MVHSAWAVDPNRHISQYAHSSWLVLDGVISGIPRVFAQTGDGYLWIGTTTGLFRFDGAHFVPWVPGDGQQLPSPRINSLLGAGDGSLWIGTAAGLSHWSDNHLTNYPSAPGIVPSILQANDGTIWFVLSDPTAAFGRLCQIAKDAIQCHGIDEGIPQLNYTPLAEDPNGNFWLGAPTALVRWKPGSHRLFIPSDLRSNKSDPGVSSLAVNQDGSLWVGFGKSGSGGGLRRLVEDVWRRFQTPEWDGRGVKAKGMLLDRENALWIASDDKSGIFRIYDGKVERLGSADGLSSDEVLGFFEDREGNLWVSTTKGIDNFRNLRVVSVSTREGLTTEEVDSVVVSRKGAVFVGGAETLDVLQGDHISSFLEGKGVSGVQVTSLFEDHADQLWVGLDNTLAIYKHGQFHRINRRDGSPMGMIVGITEDVDENVWAEARGTPMTLFRIRNLKVQEEFPAPQMPAARRVAADPEGGIWLGLITGDLARYQHGQTEIFRFPHSVDSRVEQVTVNSDGSVLGATAFGLIGWKNGKQSTLTARNGLPCNSVFSFIRDDRENLWLYTECGLVEIAGSELRQWWDDPRAIVQAHLFGILDGAQPNRPPFASAARTTDGRLWFANGVLVQTIDPDLAANSIPPPVHIEGIVADRRSYSPQSRLRLPALTRDLEIDYTALSFVAPQKVSFRYKLEGRDKNWQEPGTRRQAFYSDLRPGQYRFRVIACNNDGLWNTEGARLTFIVLPAFYQTIWFLCSMIGFFLATLWIIFHVRLRAASAALESQLGERLMERDRIARDLHDTLLQGFQALLLRLHTAMNTVAPDAPAHQMMENALDRADEVLLEGRNRVKDLRSHETGRGNLVEPLEKLIEELRELGGPNLRLTVVGEPRALQFFAADETYLIAREALGNAMRHSLGSEVLCELHYEENGLVLVSRDNGVGIGDEALASGGKNGHWGLLGMRERSRKIEATFTIDSRPSGTRIELRVPGRSAFAVYDKGPLHRFLSRVIHRSRVTYVSTDKRPKLT
jgi:signal transduction histidine kinase/ligand-binding sensor domain-containing protein